MVVDDVPVLYGECTAPTDEDGASRPVGAVIGKHTGFHGDLGIAGGIHRTAVLAGTVAVHGGAVDDDLVLGEYRTALLGGVVHDHAVLEDDLSVVETNGPSVVLAPVAVDHRVRHGERTSGLLHAECASVLCAGLVERDRAVCNGTAVVPHVDAQTPSVVLRLVPCDQHVRQREPAGLVAIDPSSGVLGLVVAHGTAGHVKDSADVDSSSVHPCAVARDGSAVDVADPALADVDPSSAGGVSSCDDTGGTGIDDSKCTLDLEDVSVGGGAAALPVHLVAVEVHGYVLPALDQDPVLAIGVQILHDDYCLPVAGVVYGVLKA